MPLIHGKSKNAFEKNLKTEIHEGKPLKQSLAIAYSLKRKAQRQKMADGGPVSSPSPSPTPHDPWQITNTQTPESNASNSKLLATRKKYANGGFVAEEEQSGYPPLDPPDDEDTEYATREAKLNQHLVAAMDSHMDGIVDRIMEQRSKDFSGDARLMSEGGRVANADEPEADFLPNEFDDLHLRDDLESTYGEDDNAGDELGNAQEDQDRDDIVARIMASRRKKDRMPRPA